MTTLQNFPMVSQNSTITDDGKPSNNAQFDCVAASIDAACRYLLGTPENSIFNPDNFKDQAEGQNYVGFTAAKDYVSFCKSLGIDLYPLTANPAQLVVLAHESIAGGKPVVFTEPDPYVSSSLGWTHVCVFYAEGPGTLTAMDPWTARPVQRTDQEWTQLLLFNQIWILQKMEEEVPITIDISNPTVAAYFKELDKDHWQCIAPGPSQGKIIQFGNLAFYKQFGNWGLCGLTWLGLPRSNEIPLDAKGNTRQHFENGVVFYDPGHIYDTRPGGTGPVYLAHIYSGPGQDPRIAPLQEQIATLQTQLATLEKQPAMPALYADMQSIKVIAEKY